MEEKYYYLLSDYLTKSFVNFSMQWHILVNYAQKIGNNSDFIRTSPFTEEIKSSQSEISKLDKILQDENMEDIFLKMQEIANADIQSEILIKSFVVSYFSIFESYIRNMGEAMGIDHTENLENILNGIGVELGIKVRALSGEKIYKGFLEFKKRRNQLIHYDGMITEDYVYYVNRYQLMDFIFEIYSMDNLSLEFEVGKKIVSTPNYFQIIHVKIDTIGYMLGVLLMQKELTGEEFYLKLNKLEELAIMNDKFTIVGTTYNRLKNKIQFNNLSKIHNMYCLFKFKDIFINRGMKKRLKKIETDIDKAKSEFNFEVSTDIERIKYYSLLGDYDQVNNELGKCEFNSELLYKILDTVLVENYIRTNIKYLSKIVKKHNIEVVIRRNMTVIGCNNIKLLIDELGKQ